MFRIFRIDTILVVYVYWKIAPKLRFGRSFFLLCFSCGSVGKRKDFRSDKKFKKLFRKQLDGARIYDNLFDGNFGAMNIGLTLFDGTFGAKNIGLTLEISKIN